VACRLARSACWWRQRRRRRPLLRVPESAAGVPHTALWDFVFYASVGVVVTSSVAIAGVLLVFSLLIIPAVIGMLFARGIVAALLVGWAAGLLASTGGFAASMAIDLPTGATLVLALATALLLAGAVRVLFCGAVELRRSAECHDRGCTCRQGWQGICDGRLRDEGARHADRQGDRRDRHAVARIQQATQQAVAMIQGIAGTIGEINAIAEAIAAAVEEQSATTQEIARNVHQAASDTQKVSSTIAGVKQDTAETGNAANQVLTAAHQLSQQARTLTEEVDQFLSAIKAAQA